MSDLNELKAAGIGSLLKKNGQVILMSCSTAAGAGFKNPDFASALRPTFSHASQNGIQAPVVDSSYYMVQKIFGQYVIVYNADGKTFESNPERILYRNE